MPNPNLNLLCIGGPKDGERVDINSDLFDSGGFRVAAHSNQPYEWDRLSPIALNQSLVRYVWYYIHGIKTNGETRFIAAAEGVDWAQALIDNYNPKKETTSGPEGKTPPEGTKPGEAKSQDEGDSRIYFYGPL